MQNRLFGDGIRDDYPAIQEMLDSGISEVVLPPPVKNYTIGKTLKIHGGQSLRLSPFTRIRLADGADCCMLEDDDFSVWKENISVEGGIWDMNHAKQSPNPYHFPNANGETFYDKIKKIGWKAESSGVFADTYTGICMRFCRVRNFSVKGITFLNPVIYAVQIAYAERFTFRDITFDYTEGSPRLWNMDGIHVEGNCKDGVLQNLKGACHDDLVAITSDDGLYGPIENIVVDGIFAHHSHSAVRLLSHGIPVKNIHIRNIYGSFYTYCVSLTKYYNEDEAARGVMKNITLEDIAASASVGTADVGGGNFPFLWVEKGLDVEDLRISRVVREESAYPTPMLKIDKGARVKRLWLTDLHQKSLLGHSIALFVQEGDVEEAHIDGLCNE